MSRLYDHSAEVAAELDLLIEREGEMTEAEECGQLLLGRVGE